MLHDLQYKLLQGIYNAEGSDTPEFTNSIEEGGALSPVERLDVYRDSIFGGMCKALAQIYPVCQRLVGEHFFDAMVTKYIAKTPSHSPDLNNYGSNLAGFIEAFAPAEPLPYLPDIARLEWAWHRAFYGADSGKPDYQALANIPERQRDTIVFELFPTVTLLVSDYPIHRIWQMNQDDYEGDDEIDLDQGGIHLVVWRDGYDMRMDVINADEWAMLELMKAQRPLNEIISYVLTKHPEADFSALLPRVIQRGCIASFHCQKK